MHPLLNIASQAALLAGKTIVQAYDHLDSVKVHEKATKDFVTEIDKVAEEQIIQTIHKAYPDHAILAEESGEHQGSHVCWVIDPLDGTHNFMHGLPHFAVSIGVKVHGQLQIGVVYDPLRQEMFMASKGEGARLNDRRIRVSQTNKFEKSLLATGFPVRQPELLLNYLKGFARILPKTSGVRRAGAAALDLAYVASGRVDGFWELYLQPWDMAAGALIAQEAGALVTAADGEAGYLDKHTIVAANPHLHPLICDLLQHA